MKQNDLCHPYINDDGVRVNGAAAFSHYVFTEKGGIQAYNDEIGKEYIDDFIEQRSNAINEKLAKKARKSRLKVVS